MRPHKYFERDGNDIYCVIPISLTQAALGADIEVNTIDDKRVKIKIPSGVQNGKILRLRNRGVPYLHNSDKRGDMYIKLHIQIPKRVSSKAKVLLRELADVIGEDGRPDPVPLTEL